MDRSTVRDLRVMVDDMNQYNDVVSGGNSDVYQEHDISYVVMHEGLQKRDKLSTVHTSPSISW